MLRALRGLAVLCAVCLASPALAAERKVSFADAVAAAVRNPRVVAGEKASTGLAEAHRASPRLDANPVVALTAGPRVTPSSERGLEASLGIAQSVGLEGQAGLRKEALGAEASWLRAEVDVEVLARRLAAASAWLLLWAAEAEVALLENDVVNEAELVRLVGRLAKAQERTTADVATAETRLAEAHLRSLTAEGMRAEARGGLAAEIAPGLDDVLVTVGAPPSFAALSAEDQRRILLRAEALPAVHARLLLAHAELLRAREDRATRGARLTVGADVRRDALGATLVQGSVAVPLPVFAVGAREYASRHASAQRFEGEKADEEIRTRAALLLAFHEVEHTEEVSTLLETSLVPAAERAMALRERELKAGEGTLLEVIDARRTLLDARTRRIRAARDRAWARVRIELIAQAIRGAR